jgi:hypothetical protein
VELSLIAFLALVGVPLFLGGALLRTLGIGVRTEPLAWFGWAWLVGALDIGAL